MAPECPAVVHPASGDLRAAGTFSSVSFNHFSLIFENVSGMEASEYLKQAILGPSAWVR